MIESVVAALREEAEDTNERRMLVVSGDHESCLEVATEALEAFGASMASSLIVGDSPGPGVNQVEPNRTDTVLGNTFEAVVYDGHDGLWPNAVGRVVGTVDGGGLFVLLTPPLDEWAEEFDPADEAFAVPPFDVTDVSGRFRRRFVQTLHAHRGIAILDVDNGRVVDDGLMHPAPRIVSEFTPAPPDESQFPEEAYAACRTDDQVAAVAGLESLLGQDSAVVVEADRGRGKSSATGLAAGSLASMGEDVVVTAPSSGRAAEVFARAESLLESLNALTGRADDGRIRLKTTSGGTVRFESPVDAETTSGDVVIVDEAAALPVATLRSYLESGRVAYTTTLHGYEGAGRGFSVRFKDHLAASDLDVSKVDLADPIRYAAGDPIEVWSFRALLLDASPAAGSLLEGASVGTATYRPLDAERLLADEWLLREAFGLLVLAHYKTEPTDLARLLDAPNIEARGLLVDGHVASIALLAREGDLAASTRSRMYEGARVRGNMIPDVLTSQLGDERAGEPAGLRVLRIATHEAVRSRGLGTHLLQRMRDEFGSDVDWLGVGFGATPDLLSFWRENDFSTVHLSTKRNETSGEHSAIMLSPTSEDGRALHDRHAARFADRIVGVLSDTLRDLDPDVVRTALGSVDTDVSLDLSADEWRHVTRMAAGPGLMDVDPNPFRCLARKHLIDPASTDILSPAAERLLVRKVLQANGWTAVADDLDFHSRRECMRATGDIFETLVMEYGSEAARAGVRRFRDE